MIYVTGDIHGGLDIGKLNTRNFPEQKEMTKDDFVIICGDFGFPWGGRLSGEDRYWLKWLEDKPWTTLYVDGNHENFDLLEIYPVEDWNGGKIQKLNSSVFHLCRGSVFTLQDMTFFAFGGAKSHDIAYRIPHRSWWPQEEPSPAECEAGLAALDAVDWKVDYVLTHTAPLILSPTKMGAVQKNIWMQYIRGSHSATGSAGIFTWTRSRRQIRGSGLWIGMCSESGECEAQLCKIKNIFRSLTIRGSFVLIYNIGITGAR